MTISEILEESRKELIFVEEWQKEKTGKEMRGFLKGKRHALRKIIKQLEEYEG